MLWFGKAEPQHMLLLFLLFPPPFPLYVTQGCLSKVRFVCGAGPFVQSPMVHFSGRKRDVEVWETSVSRASTMFFPGLVVEHATIRS